MIYDQTFFRLALAISVTSVGLQMLAEDVPNCSVGCAEDVSFHMFVEKNKN